MNSRIRRFLIVGLCALTLAFSSAAIATLSDNRVDAETQRVWSDVSLSDSYVQGEEIVIPERTLTYAGETVKASVTVTFPDGMTTSSTAVKLSIAGKYTVDYTAIIGGRVYKQTETFVAKYKTVSYSSDATSVNYGTHTLAPDYPGLMVRIPDGDKLVFNEILDVSSAKISDVLFEAFVTADNPGTIDFNQLWVQLTDIENPNLYFRVRFIHTQSSTGGPYTYVLAGANDQPMTGLEGSKLHVSDIWGAVCRHSFQSYYNEANTEVGKTRLDVRFDAETKAVYCGNTFIIDLDSTQYFDTPWSGFSSEKVRVSAWAEAYSSSSANFVITKVGNIDVSKATIEENEAPELTINTEYTADTMPKAEVGKAYAVPSATAFDIYSGECKVTTEVYYNYTGQASLVTLKEGKFTPNYLGKYAIIYKAYDYMGNEASKVLWVDAIADVNLPTVELKGSLPSSINAGSKITLPEYEVIGGSGNSSVQIFVNDGKTETEITNGEYLFNAVGKHTFKWVATDHIGQTSELVVEVNANKGTAPVFVDRPIFPKYYIASTPYVAPKLYANDYTSGALVRRLASLTVTDVNGTKALANGEIFTPEVANNFDVITLTYKVDEVTYEVKIPAVKARDVNGVYIANYFDLSGVTLALGSSNGTVTATQSNGSWIFANSLLAEGLEIVLDADATNSKFDAIKAVFTDSENSAQAVEVILKNTGKTTDVQIGESVFVDEGSGFASTAKSNRFKVMYYQGVLTVNGSGLTVKSYANGQAFNGFDSGKVYVTVEFVNAEVGASYQIAEVNGQKVTTTTLDRVAPKITILGVTGGSYNINESAVLPAALAGDTLDPNVTFTLRVLTPSLEVVTATDGTVLDNVDPTREYEIKFTEYGAYKVSYQAKDSFSGRTTNLVYNIAVDDTQGPVITFASPIKRTAKVGDTLIIPDYTLSDNVDEASAIISMNSCLVPGGEIVEMNESNAIIATRAGVYQLRVFAMDTAGNITLFRVNVVVTA
ncbi:MAG: hypothetical protein IJA15_04975 [Clostridia bacterium]|nr:hypothetical protein [Clostridia bacterium]